MTRRMFHVKHCRPTVAEIGVDAFDTPAGNT